MNKNWKQVAEGWTLDIPASDLETLQPVMDALETTVRPLLQAVPHDTEPALVFQCGPEEES